MTTASLSLATAAVAVSVWPSFAVPEITGVATVVNARTLLFVQVFGIAVALYLVLSYGLSAVATVIERLGFKAPAPSRARKKRAMRLIGAQP